MISKRLFVKWMKENTKQRLWSVALITLIFFFLFPVTMALNISSEFSRLDGSQADLARAAANLTRTFVSWCSLENGGLIMMMLLLAVVCGVSGFSWLHSKRKTDFYHSLPLRRETLFFVAFVNGILYVAIPYAVMLTAAALLVKSRGCAISWSFVAESYFLHLSFFLLVYVTAIIAVLMTGNTLVSLLGVLVFFLWGPGVVMLLEGYRTEYYQTYYSTGEWAENWKRVSPAAWYIAAAGSDRPVSMALWALLAAVILLLAALVLCRKRPSEAAGRAMAFAISRPVIKFLLVVPIALSVSLMFFAMMKSGSWAVFGLVSGLLISYCVIEIIYNFDFKKLFAHRGQLAACAVAAAAVLAFFRFDLSGYDSFLPSRERVQSAGLYTRYLDPDAAVQYWVSPSLRESQAGGYLYVDWKYPDSSEIADAMQLADLDDVFAVAGQGVEDALALRGDYLNGTRSLFADREVQENGDEYGTLLLAWHLADGRTVYRNYFMNLSAVMDSITRIHDSESYKEAIYPALSWTAEEIAGVNYSEAGEYFHVALETEEQKRMLLETYQKELRGLTEAVRRTESPVGALQFKTNEMQGMIDRVRQAGSDWADFNYYCYYPLYPSFTETIRLLDRLGTEVGSFLTKDTTEAITLTFCGTKPQDPDAFLANVPGPARERIAKYWQEGTPFTVSVWDPEAIQEILDACVSVELNAENPLNKLYMGLSVEAYRFLPAEEDTGEADEGVEEELAAVRTETAEGLFDVQAEAAEEDARRVYGLRFDFDRIPQTVKDTFGLTQEILALN